LTKSIKKDKKKANSTSQVLALPKKEKKGAKKSFLQSTKQKKKGKKNTMK